MPPRSRAFTIIELIIIIGILLILAGIALANARGILQEQKISNHINEMTGILEGMRNTALTNQNSQITGLRMEFVDLNPLNNNTGMEQRELGGANPALDIRKNYSALGFTLSVEKQTDIAPNAPVQCNQSASIEFEAQTGKVFFSCNDNSFARDLSIAQLKIGLTDASTATRKRFFNIHRAAGIPQPVIE